MSTDQHYARIRYGGSSWVDTYENSVTFICDRRRDRDEDYEVSAVSMTRERLEALPEFAGP